MKKSNSVKKNNVKSIFNPALFWDAEDIDIKKHAEYIIARVLDYGDEKDIVVLRSMYSDKEIINVVKKRRGLMPQTGMFWAVNFKIPPGEIACLKMYYHKKQ